MRAMANQTCAGRGRRGSDLSHVSAPVRIISLAASPKTRSLGRFRAFLGPVKLVPICWETHARRRRREMASKTSKSPDRFLLPGIVLDPAFGIAVQDTVIRSAAAL
jgi:hypothetical protein